MTKGKRRKRKRKKKNEEEKEEELITLTWSNWLPWLDRINRFDWFIVILQAIQKTHKNIFLIENCIWLIYIDFISIWEHPQGMVKSTDFNFYCFYNHFESIPFYYNWFSWKSGGEFGFPRGTYDKIAKQCFSLQTYDTFWAATTPLTKY